MTFLSLVLIQFFKAYNFRSQSLSISRKPFSNRWLNLAISWELLMLAAVIYVPILAVPFSTFRMTVEDWLIVLAGSLTVIPVIEVVKWFVRKGMFGLKA